MNRSTLFAWTISFCTCIAASAAGAADAPARKPFAQKVEGSFVSLEMVPIPAGKFTPSTGDGKPGKEVEVKPFYMSRTELIWDLYDIYALSLDLTEQQRLQDDAVPKESRSRPSKAYGVPDYGHGHIGYAALSMTPKSAQGFCKWLSAKTGRKYRLPTEIEWEYAARAGGPAEVDPKALPDIAWHKENSDEKTYSVGELKPNAWGLHDMLGNAAEWCIDVDGKPVARGGSHRTKAKDLDYARRDYPKESWNSDPQDPKSTWWFSNCDFVGFRVVCEE